MASEPSPFQVVWMNQWHQAAGKPVVVDLKETIPVPPGSIFMKVEINPALVKEGKPDGS